MADPDSLASGTQCALAAVNISRTSACAAVGELDGVDWEGLGHKATVRAARHVDQCLAAGKAINWEGIGESTLSTCKNACEQFAGALEDVDWATIAERAVRATADAGARALEVVGEVPWESVASSACAAAYDAAEAVPDVDLDVVPWSDVAATARASAKEAVDAAAAAGDSVDLETLASAVSGAIKDGCAEAAEILEALPWDELAAGVVEGATALGDASAEAGAALLAAAGEVDVGAVLDEAKELAGEAQTCLVKTLQPYLKGDACIPFEHAIEDVEEVGNECVSCASEAGDGTCDGPLVALAAAAGCLSAMLCCCCVALVCPRRKPKVEVEKADKPPGLVAKIMAFVGPVLGSVYFVVGSSVVMMAMRYVPRARFEPARR